MVAVIPVTTVTVYQSEVALPAAIVIRIRDVAAIALVLRLVTQNHLVARERNAQDHIQNTNTAAFMTLITPPVAKNSGLVMGATVAVGAAKYATRVL